MGTAGCSQAHLASTARLARERALLGGFCRRHGRPPARRIRWSVKEIFAGDRTKRIPGLGSQTMGGLSPSTAPRLMQLDPRSPVAVPGLLSWKIKLSHSWVPEWIGVSGRAKQAQLAAQIQMPSSRQLGVSVAMQSDKCRTGFGHQHRWRRSPDAPPSSLPKLKPAQRAPDSPPDGLDQNAMLCVLVARLGRRATCADA